MDAGSGINLIYAKTLRAMHISLEFSLTRRTRRRRSSGVKNVDRRRSPIATRRPTSMNRLEAKRKEKRSISETKSNRTIHKRRIFTKAYAL
jgi:hypothetical protein